MTLLQFYDYIRGHKHVINKIFQFLSCEILLADQLFIKDNFVMFIIVNVSRRTMNLFFQKWM